MHSNLPVLVAVALLTAGCAKAAPESPPPRTPPATPPGATVIDAIPMEISRQEFEKTLEREYAPLRAKGIEGVAEVWMRVTEEGIVAEARIRDSSGHPELDAIALRVARTKRFRPASNRGEPTEIWIAVPIEFKAR